MKKLYKYNNRNFIIEHGGGRVTMEGLPTFNIYIDPTPKAWVVKFREHVLFDTLLDYENALELSCKYLLALELGMAKRNRVIDGLKDYE